MEKMLPAEEEAYKWALEQLYFSVAARHARTLAQYIRVNLDNMDCAVCEGTGRLSGEKYDSCPACGIQKKEE